MRAGQYVDMNDGYGFQKVQSVGGHYFRLFAGGEFLVDDRYEVRDADEIEFDFADRSDGLST